MTVIKKTLLMLTTLVTLSSALTALAEESSAFVERSQASSARAVKH
ncbi:hypothetical protein [Pseudomonas putida]|uniref:Uncharacterized protein n=1 Tax=Pseudomonas putida TaxID=303 RepID=A0A6I7EJV7_PSEPU|nr:hypothetical protein [Pseudomonas putida]QHW08408.1 hypothetical protein C2H86_28625 [Pseudomonas putida]